MKNQQKIKNKTADEKKLTGMEVKKMEIFKQEISEKWEKKVDKNVNF